MPIKSSELILNDDGSIYHLNLKPEHIANTIITVGDPDRVDDITKHFESVEFQVTKREFHTQTGYYKNQRFTVISTGIGTDNIDIVLNELDALVNIDLKTREIKSRLTSLNIVRIGTSGTIRNDISLGSYLISEFAIGFDNLLRYYNSDSILNKRLSQEFVKQTEWDISKGIPYVVECNQELLNHLHSDKTIKGFTGTNVGFYGPQGRILRLELSDHDMNEKLINFVYKDKKITNLEMETSGIYGMASLLGHKAISMNAILANRSTGEFSDHPKKIVNDLIIYTLDKLVSSMTS